MTQSKQYTELKVIELPPEKSVIKAVVGMCKEDAIKFINENKMVPRLCSLNGISLVVTRDYKTNRINLCVVDEKISDAFIG